MSKMIIVVRKDLNMRKGKIAAQVAHAAAGILLNQMRDNSCHTDYVPDIRNGEYHMTLHVKENSPLDDWLRGCFKKICVYVNSEEELLALHAKAQSDDYMNCLVTDNGLTEFHGVQTNTCLAIGPDTDERMDAITGHLPLL